MSRGLYVSLLSRLLLYITRSLVHQSTFFAVMYRVSAPRFPFEQASQLIDDAELLCYVSCRSQRYPQIHDCNVDESEQVVHVLLLSTNDLQGATPPKDRSNAGRLSSGNLSNP